MIDCVFLSDILFILLIVGEILVIEELFCFVSLVVIFNFGFEFFFFMGINVFFEIELCLFVCVVDFIIELCVWFFDDDCVFVLFVMWLLIELFVVLVFVFEWGFVLLMFFFDWWVEILVEFGVEILVDEDWVDFVFGKLWYFYCLCI